MTDHQGIDDTQAASSGGAASASIEERKLDLEWTKFRTEQNNNARSRLSSPLVLSIVAGVAALFTNALALAGNGYLTYLKGQDDLALERTRQQGTLILESLKTGNVDLARQNLRLLATADLVDEQTRNGILNALAQGITPGLPSGSNTPPINFKTGIVSATQSLESGRACLAAAGAKYTIRYYSQHSWKTLKAAEAHALATSGIRVIPLYEDGANLSGFSKASGQGAGGRAFSYAANTIGQPAGSFIFFAIDLDPSDADVRNSIIPYFQGIQEANDSLPSDKRYRIGVYGSGAVGEALREAHLVDAVWLAFASHFRGSSDMRAKATWDLDQEMITEKTVCGVQVNDLTRVKPELTAEQFSFVPAKS